MCRTLGHRGFGRLTARHDDRKDEKKNVNAHSNPTHVCSRRLPISKKKSPALFVDAEAMNEHEDSAHVHGPFYCFSYICTSLFDEERSGLNWAYV